MIILDFDLDLLKELILIIDQQLDIIYKKGSEVDDPDSFGYYDSAEHLTGLGFVACQTYMASVYGYFRIKKKRALSIGPLHSCGQTKAQIINHAANYWKHNNEWTIEHNEKQRKYIEEAFESVGFPVDTDYPLSGILTEITSPEKSSFTSIITILETWRDDVNKSTT